MANGNENAIRSRLREAVARIYEESSGEIEAVAVSRAAYEGLKGSLSEDEIAVIVHLACDAEVRLQRKVRGTDKGDDGQGELWPESTMRNALLPVRRGVDMKVRHAPWKVHQVKREAQIQNQRKVTAAFNLWEQRREILAPVMEGTDKTTEEALRELGQWPAALA